MAWALCCLNTLAPARPAGKLAAASTALRLHCFSNKHRSLPTWIKGWQIICSPALGAPAAAP